LCLFGEQDTFYFKGFAVVMDFQAEWPPDFCECSLSHSLALRMFFDIGQRRLGDAIKHGSLGAVQLFHLRKGREVNANFRPFGKFFDEGLESGNQPQVIQHGRA
jgi:hypothetical protein